MFKFKKSQKITLKSLKVIVLMVVFCGFIRSVNGSITTTNGPVFKHNILSSSTPVNSQNFGQSLNLNQIHKHRLNSHHHLHTQHPQHHHHLQQHHRKRGYLREKRRTTTSTTSMSTGGFLSKNQIMGIFAKNDSGEPSYFSCII